MRTIGREYISRPPRINDTWEQFDAVMAIVGWFLDNFQKFERPLMKTNPIFEQHNFGGAYYAETEVRRILPSEIPDEWIREALDKIENGEPKEWIINLNRLPNRQKDSARELDVKERQEEMLKSLRELVLHLGNREHFEEDTIGNNPPPELTDYSTPLSLHDRDTLLAAVAELQNQPPVRELDDVLAVKKSDAVKVASTVIEEKEFKVRDWLLKHGIEPYVESLSKTLGEKTASAAYWTVLGTLLLNAVKSIHQWTQAMGLFLP